jgi:riboflavin kinase/FMN adenylyltransferase
MEVIFDLPVKADSPIALTIGKFDGVHLGHQAVIERLKRDASARKLPACVLTFDPHPIEFFLGERAPTRLTALPDKIRLLGSHGIDRLYVCPFTDAIARMSPEVFIVDVLVGQFGVRSLLVGEDFHFGAGRGGDVATLKTLGREVGLDVAILEGFVVEGVRVSSTAIRAAIAKGDADCVRHLLGRPPPPPMS